MKHALIILVASAWACSTKGPPERTPKPPAVLQFAVEGTIQSLRFDGGALLFCDGRGSHRVDLKAGAVAVDRSPCPAQEANAGCGVPNLDVSVRSPLSEPNDIVDLKAFSFPLTGRVHDCAAASNHLIVGTGSAVFLIDTTQNAIRTVSHDGSDRVAATQDWMAWAEGASIRLARLD